MKTHLTNIFFCMFFFVLTSKAQKTEISFGTDIAFSQMNTSKKSKSSDIKWINVNTDPDTWRKEADVLICKGTPIGVMRSEKQYENFILHVEWKHMELGGNSGIFVWSDAVPFGNGPLPSGVEVQMLDLDWVNQNSKNGVKQPIAYVHGELFGVGDVETLPDNPRGKRSKSIENRALGRGEWNTYDVVCIDGSIKLAVNGKFVNGISESSIKKGYLCLESEGSEIHFRNLRITELPPGVTSAEQIANQIL